MEQKTVYIIDDNHEFRESTAWLLEGAGYHVVDFSNPVDAISTLSNTQHDNAACVLLDVRMPEMSGLDVHEQLNKYNTGLPVIYMTGHGDVPVAVEAMKKGAVTYLEKPLDGMALDAALATAFERYREAMAQKNKPDQQGVEQARRLYQERYNGLTPREQEVMRGIVNGDMNKVIAYNLGISVKTIEIHRSQVKKKMKVRNMAELIKMAVTEQAYDC
jgi:two-component system response regulator FixJ